jgi:hypothetical protein
MRSQPIVARDHEQFSVRRERRGRRRCRGCPREIRELRPALHCVVRIRVPQNSPLRFSVGTRAQRHATKQIKRIRRRPRHGPRFGPRQQAPHLGVLPGGNTAWVSQDHTLGRLSFYEPSTDSLDTITGFELNSEIEHD